MLFRTLLAAVTLAGFTHAQTEDIPDDERLDVVFGPRPIHAPGALMHPGHMSNTPNISTPTWDQANPSALLFMVDLDWPLDNQRVSRLHWLVTGLTLASGTPPPDGNNTALMNIPDPPIVQYLPAAPPVGDVAHSYMFYLFATPPSFALPGQYTDLSADDSFNENGTLVPAATRAPFDVAQFLLDCGLDSADVLARNYVRVRNLAGTDPTVTFPPARQPTGTREDVVTGQSAVPEQSAATSQTPAASSGGASRAEGGTGVWRWMMLFVLNGLLYVVA